MQQYGQTKRLPYQCRSQKDKHHKILYVESKLHTNEHICEIETVSLEQTCGSQAGVGREEGRIGSLGSADSNCYTKGG